MTHTYDAIVIGTGQAGPSLAERLSKAGQKVAIIEKGKFGGTCVNTGCIPTKTMVASAYAAHLARRAQEYGVELGGPVVVNMKRVKQRKDEISGRSNRGVEKWVRGLANATVYQGHARFVGPGRLRVNDSELTADKIFINVGGRPLIPPMPGVQTVPFLTSESMMDVDFLPEHLIVVGGSYIGLEFGQMFRRFGSRVTVIEQKPRLVVREDEDVSDAVRDILQSEGIEIRLNASCIGFQHSAASIIANVDCTSGAPAIEGSHLLLAVGRVPNTDDLGLVTAGIQTDDKGYIKVDDALRTTAPGVWALGDCNGKGAFTHTSYNDYEIVAANLLDGANRKWTDRITSYALFIDPPLGRIGMTDAEARRSGRKFLVGKRQMTRVNRAVEKGETQGFMKFLIDAQSKHIVSATILGTGGDEVVHSLFDAIYAGQPYTDVVQRMRIHPTVSELIPTALSDLQPLG